MSYEFIVESRYPGDDWGNRRRMSRLEMLARLDRFLGDKGYYASRLRGRGAEFGPWLLRNIARRRVARRTADRGDDYQIFVQRRRDKKVLSIHKVEKVRPMPDLRLGCHPQIELAYELLMQRFGVGGIDNGGVYYCRNVEGSSVVSRHGYHDYPRWKGAAGDIFSDPDNMGALTERAYFLVAMVKAGKVDLDRIIVGQSQWTQAGGWEYYGGVYHRHIHIEVWSGRPCSP